VLRIFIGGLVSRLAGLAAPPDFVTTVHPILQSCSGATERRCRAAGRGWSVLGKSEGHAQLTYRHMGRDFRLTEVHGSVVKKEDAA